MAFISMAIDRASSKLLVDQVLARPCFGLRLPDLRCLPLPLIGLRS